MSKGKFAIKMVHAEVMDEACLSIGDLSKKIQLQINDLNLLKKRLYVNKDDVNLRHQLKNLSISISDEIKLFIEDNLFQPNNNDIENNNEINSRPIDISDLLGTYTLSEMTNIINTITDRVEKIKSGDTFFIKNIRMSARLKNILLNEDFITINQLCNLKKREILSIKGMGESTFNELKEIMNEHRLGFKKINI